MNKLKTPFGDICVKINGQINEYTFEELEKVCPYDDGTGYLFNVDGRFKIIPHIEQFTDLPLEMECFIDKSEHIEFDDRTGSEGGECMVMWSMYNGNIKLSIGGLDDLPGYDEDGLSGYYLSNGVGITIVSKYYLKYA